MIEQLRAKAKELLEKREAGVVIGYGRGTNETTATPVFIASAARAGELIFNPFCYNNLLTFVTRDEHKQLGKPAVVARECDMKAAIVLVQEDQIKADGIILLSVSCDEQGRADAACRFNGAMTIPEAEEWLKKNYRAKELTADKTAQVAELEKMSDAERWAFWSREFERCIKCYACRQACPLCYCRQCIVEKNLPQWVLTSPHPAGNMAWNIVRAFHLAGRCIDCGECERACPVGIPLLTLNRALQKEVRRAFDYVSGYDHAGKPVMASFKKDDDEEFIK
jgi:formate hydrogenlyase subunit 6/NADH:ubiquinone oxidoreductase subunit I